MGGEGGGVVRGGEGGVWGRFGGGGGGGPTPPLRTRHHTKKKYRGFPTPLPSRLCGRAPSGDWNLGVKLAQGFPGCGFAWFEF